jgi:hypothetical protein
MQPIRSEQRLKELLVVQLFFALADYPRRRPAIRPTPADRNDRK